MVADLRCVSRAQVPAAIPNACISHSVYAAAGKPVDCTPVDNRHRMTILVITVVSAALIIGAAWGIHWGLAEKTEGFLVALAGGSLLVTIVLERIERATRSRMTTILLASPQRWVWCRQFLLNCLSG